MGSPSEVSKRLRARLKHTMALGRVPMPPVPQVAMELHQLAVASDPQMSEAVALVERDPQMAARVLQLASSAAYGRTPATDLHDASMRTGLRGLRDIAFAMSAGDVLGAGAMGDMVKRVNAHSYVVARGAAFLCLQRGLDPDHGFLCGLLHDVGRVAMGSLFAAWGKRDARWLDLEFVEPFIDELHEDIGMRLLAGWDVDGLIKLVVARHHRPETAGRARSVALAVAAANIADNLGARTAAQTAEVLHELPIAELAELTSQETVNLAEVIVDARTDRLVRALSQ